MIQRKFLTIELNLQFLLFLECIKILISYNKLSQLTATAYDTGIFHMLYYVISVVIKYIFSLCVFILSVTENGKLCFWFVLSLNLGLLETSSLGYVPMCAERR